jgi:hypothetical protein
MKVGGVPDEGVEYAPRFNIGRCQKPEFLTKFIKVGGVPDEGDEYAPRFLIRRCQKPGILTKH